MAPKIEEDSDSEWDSQRDDVIKQSPTAAVVYPNKRENEVIQQQVTADQSETTKSRPPKEEPKGGLTFDNPFKVFEMGTEGSNGTMRNDVSRQTEGHHQATGSTRQDKYAFFTRADQILMESGNYQDLSPPLPTSQKFSQTAHNQYEHQKSGKASGGNPLDYAVKFTNGENGSSDRRNTEQWQSIDINSSTEQQPSGLQFDRVDPRFIRTNNSELSKLKTKLGDKSVLCSGRIFAEAFAILEVPVAFLIAFIVQLVRFLLDTIFRQLLFGLAQATLDIVFKPTVIAIFNQILAPLGSLLFNIFCFLQKLSVPLSGILKNVLSPFAMLLQSFRLFEVNNLRSFQGMQDSARPDQKYV